MSVIISCSSIKGGCSKTATAVNLAAAIAEHDYKVLLVDLDIQANASLSLRVPVGKQDLNIANVMMPLKDQRKVEIEDVIFETEWDNLYIAPAGLELTLANMQLASVVARESILKKQLEKPNIQEMFDFIIIDTAPHVDILLLNAFAASNYVIGVATYEGLSLTGIELMMYSYNEIKDSGINSDLKFLGVIASKHNRTNHAKQVEEVLRERYDILGTVSTSVKVSEATTEGVPLVYWLPHNKVSMEYKAIAEALIQKYNDDIL